MITNIEWKDVVGYKGVYQVSNLGEVKRVSKNKLLTPYVGAKSKGYMYVKLCMNGVRCKKALHRIVAEAFIPNPLDKPEVNHIDGNKSNNCVTNLEWVTRSENEQHSYSVLNKDSGKKLSAEQRDSVLYLRDTLGLTFVEIASKLNVTPSNVRWLYNRRKNREIC